MNKMKLLNKALNVGAAGAAIGMKVFLTMAEPKEFSAEWLHSLSNDELEIQLEKARLQLLRKDKKAQHKLDLLNEEKKRRLK